MELVRSLRELFASVSDAPHADPGEVLAAGGHQALPPDLVAEAITNYADTAPLEVAQHLAPYVMAHSAVPGAAEAADWGGDGIGPDLGAGFELLSTAPASSEHPVDHDFGHDVDHAADHVLDHVDDDGTDLEHDFEHDFGRPFGADGQHDAGQDDLVHGQHADPGRHDAGGAEHVAFRPEPHASAEHDPLDLDFGLGHPAAAVAGAVAGWEPESVAHHDPAAWSTDFGGSDDPSFAEGLIDTGLDDAQDLDDDLFDHRLAEHHLDQHVDVDPDDHHDLPFDHGA